MTALPALHRPPRWLERLRRRVLGPVFDRLGYDLVPAVPDWSHRPLSPRETDALIAAAAARLDADLAAAGLSLPGGAAPAVSAFWELIGRAPVAQKRGGNGFNGALQLYVLMRALQPAAVVESGVFRGLTTWITRQACPEAEIRCFDPTSRACATATRGRATPPPTGRAPTCRGCRPPARCASSTTTSARPAGCWRRARAASTA